MIHLSIAVLVIMPKVPHLSQLMRFTWYFSSSLNSFFKRAHVQPSSGTRWLIFGRTIRLLPYFMCANSEGSGETARMRRLAWAFAGRLCDKHHNLMNYHIFLTSWRFRRFSKSLENAKFCMCDKTVSESNFLMFYSVFQFVKSGWTHVQRSHIENWVLDTVSKNFVILAFFDKNQHICNCFD